MKIAKANRVISFLSLLLVLTMVLSIFGCSQATSPNTSLVDVNPESSDIADAKTTSEGASVSTTESMSGVSGENTTASGIPGVSIQSRVTTQTSANSTPTKPTVAPGGKDDVLSQVPSKLSGQKVKVLVWWNPGNEDKQKADNFKKKTGITVSYEVANLKNYQTRLSSMIMANNAPSLAAILNEWYPQPITRGLMQSIDVTGWNYNEDIYATDMMNQFSYKGKYYGIALKGSTMSTFIVMFWNKDIFKQKGLTTTPETLWKAGNWNWDTCLDLAQKTTDPSKGISGLTLTYQYYWMLSAGQDFVLSDKNGLVNNIKSTKLLDSWNWAWDMINSHKVVDTSFTDTDPFYAGKAAMLAGGSFLMQADENFTTYVPQSMKDDWGVVPFPSPAGQKPTAACEGIVWGFPARVSGDKLQAAAWYLRYYLDDAANASPNYYPKDECWQVMEWMWNQKIQSYNSVGVLTYGGEYSAASVQYQLIDEADSKAKLKSNLDSWYSVFEANINKIVTEMD